MLRRQTNGTDPSSNRGNPMVAVATRLFWLLAAVVHFPAFLRVSTSSIAGQAAADSLGQAAGLTLAVLFCGLKALDVPFLRTSPGWRSRVAVALALVLIHAGVVGELAGQPADLKAVLCAAGSVTLLSLSLKAAVLAAAGRLVARPKTSLERNASAPGWGRLFEPIAAQLVLVCAGPRPPPATPTF